MQTDEFVRRVQEQAGIPAGDEAVDVIEATLETLGERLTAGGQSALATELPGQLKAYVRKRRKTLFAPFGVEEFYNRVSGRSGLGLPAAIKQSHVVMAVLQDAISAGTWREIRRQLPAEYDELFTGEPYGPASPAAFVESD